MLRTGLPIHIAAVAVASPLGIGAEALSLALRDSRRAPVWEDLGDGIRAPLARVPLQDNPADADRTITLLNECLGQLRDPMALLRAYVPAERRAAAVGVSKGAVLSWWRQDGALPIHTLLPDAAVLHTAQSLGISGSIGCAVAACATGLHNLALGAEWIARGDADIAIVGATEASLHPAYISSFQRLGPVTASECRPFTSERDGFAVGEGVALLLLANEDALHRSGLRPIARLSGWALGADAHSATGVDPAGTAIAATARRALAMASVPPNSLSLLQVHGTGTPANDTAEAAAIRLLGAGTVPVSALKGALGHGMGAVAALELAACVVALRDGFTPGSAGFSTLAEDCAGIRVQTSAGATAPRRILKLSGGFGGQLGAVVLEVP